VPVANAAVAAVDEDATISGSVTATDADAGQTATLIYALTGAAPTGLTFNPDGSYSFDASSYDYLADGEPLVLTVPFTASDATSTSASANLVITITGTNDVPTATNLSAAQSYTEDTALNLTDIVVSDVDNAGVTATLTLSNLSAGSLSTATAGTVTSTFSGGVWTATGAIADVNTLLAGVTFNPTANFNGSFTIATSVSDGVSAAVTGTKVITGIGVNDAPSGTTGSITIVEDKGYTFTLASFGFTDSADNPANTLAAVTITTLPTAGALLLNNAAFAAGTSVSAADIAAGKLTFVPANNSTTTASFTFQVADNGGTANGGVNLDPSADTLSLVITADQADLAGGNGATNFGITINQGNISILDSNSPGNAGDEVIAATNATSYSDMTFSRFENNLEFRGVSGSNTVHLTILDHFAGTNNAVETISFTNGGTVAGFALGTGDYSLDTDLNGGAGNDVLAGSSADDTLAGNAGNDLIFGGSAGNDSLNGGAGNDLLLGGAGSDTFVFNTALNATTNVDGVADFAADGTDSISLALAHFGGLGATGGTLNAANFFSGGVGTATADVGNAGTAKIVYDSSTGNLFYDADGGSDANRTLFADVTVTTGTFDFNDIRVGP
jgi:VCBS repeat-containing protein